MRLYPIDSTRCQMISTGSVQPVVAWVADGDRRIPDPAGRQEVDEVTGLPLWRCEVVIPSDDGDDRDRTSVTEILISAKDRPDAGTFGELLVFDQLAMQPGYVKKSTGVLTPPRWSASGIKRQHKPQAQAA